MVKQFEQVGVEPDTKSLLDELRWLWREPSLSAVIARLIRTSSDAADSLEADAQNENGGGD
jgi:hypothetical protein